MNIFSDNNVMLLLFSIIPALLYSFLIFSRVPYRVVKLRPAIIYLIIGLVSITLLSFIQFSFPHIQEYIDYYVLGIIQDGDKIMSVTKPTLFAIFIHAFFQVALIEELAKLGAFKIGNFVRGKYEIFKDKPFAVMFYCGMISVGFAFIENMSYAARAIWGDFSRMGLEPETVLVERSITSVVLHMLAGMFMGYFLALGRMFKKRLKKLLYMFFGLISAMFIHGAYDFVLMTPNYKTDFLKITDSISLHIPSVIIILFGTMTAYIMASHLLRLKYKRRKLS